MQFSPKTSMLEYFYYWEKTTPQKIYLRQPFGDTFRDFTWQEVGSQARKLASYLKANFPANTNVGLVSKNCAEWIIADLAIMMSGNVSVPFYATLTAEQLNQVLVHSECKVLFFGKLDDPKGIKKGIPSGVTCISFPTYNPDLEMVQWDEILEKNQAQKEDFLPKLDDIFSIIYTSGTTGNPKGVMLTFKAMAAGIYAAKDVGKLHTPNISFISYLPLCHIAERNVIESASIMTGGTVYFAETLESFSKNLATARPTHFLAVPRIWTKFQLGILSKMPQKKLDLYLKIPILNKIVQKKIKKGLGLDNAVVTLTGAAPMPTSLIHWFKKLDILIQDAYGMTENLGAVCMTPREKMVDGSVGKLYEGMELKLVPETGEICTRSDWNMVGYYKEPALTAETLDADGWLHTGDVGELDSENYLKITGRVKEMYKTAKGEYVAPAQIEFGFADNNFIDQICVAGQSLPQPIALIVLSEIGKSVDNQEVKESLLATLKDLNPRLKNYERIKKIVVLREAWTVENNKLTPTMKIKRNIIEREFHPKMENWYEHTDDILWE